MYINVYKMLNDSRIDKILYSLTNFELNDFHDIQRIEI